MATRKKMVKATKESLAAKLVEPAPAIAMDRTKVRLFRTMYNVRGIGDDKVKVNTRKVLAFKGSLSAFEIWKCGHSLDGLEIVKTKPAAIMAEISP